MNFFRLNKIILVILSAFLFAIPALAQEKTSNKFYDSNDNYVSGKILQIISEKNNEELEDSFQSEQIIQTVKVIILNGEYKGKVVNIENQLTSSPLYDIKIKKDDRVILNVEKTDKEVKFYISDVERVPVLLILTGIFLFLLLVIGGHQGLRSIVSLVITAVMIFFILVPSILNSYPVIPMTVIVSVISTFATMFIVAGVNIKSLAAALGTILSVVIAGILSSLAIKFAPLNGFGSQEAAMLWTGRPDLDYTGLLTASIIIASLGAVMDVGMSIASSISEFKKVNNSLTTKELITSGLNVGKDIMGTMSNTLILAYIGSAFSLVLLAANAPLIKLLNLNAIAAEITSAIIGSIGIILCVPITAIIAAYLIEQQSNKEKNTPQKEEKHEVESSL